MAFLCGHLRCDGNLVSCDTYIKSEAFARVLLYQDRKFIEWTEVDTVTGRWNNLFGASNLLEGAIKPGLTLIFYTMKAEVPLFQQVAIVKTA